MALAGTVWILQGLDLAFAPVSFMTADRTWSWIGTIAVVVGCGLLWSGVRSRSTRSSEREDG